MYPAEIPAKQNILAMAASLATAAFLATNNNLKRPLVEHRSLAHKSGVSENLF
jgi:hypothetical protein